MSSHSIQKRQRETHAPTTCQLAGDCSRIACLLLADQDQREVCTCLQHYVAQLEAGELLVDGCVSLLDELAFYDQSQGVTSLWRRAIGDLVLQMYTLQWDEERTLQSDPLAILTFNAPSKQKTLAKTMGGEVLEKTIATKSLAANSHIRHTDLLTRSKKEADDARTNPFVRRQPDYTAGSDFSFARPGETKADALRRVNKDLALEEQEASRLAESDASAQRCSSCGSPWVLIRTSETSGGTKSEVWGNKDVETSRYIQCKKCNYISQMTD